MPKRKSASSIHVVAHPLLDDMLTEARDVKTSTPRFRQLLARMGSMLAYEATRDIPTEACQVQTPLEKYLGRRLKGPITIVPILRAGLGLADGIIGTIPDSQTGHIGMFRDENQLTPIGYYQKLPANISGGPVLLVDPMLATGGSALSAIELLLQHHCRDIRLICLLAAPEGVKRVVKEYPHVKIFTASIDRELDDRGFILPGLGDAGDRLFGTAGT